MESAEKQTSFPALSTAPLEISQKRRDSHIPTTLTNDSLSPKTKNNTPRFAPAARFS